MDMRQRKHETSGKAAATIGARARRGIRRYITEKDMARLWTEGNLKELRKQRQARRGPPCRLLDGEVIYPVRWFSLWSGAVRVIEGQMFLAGGGLIPAAHEAKYEAALETARKQRRAVRCGIAA